MGIRYKKIWQDRRSKKLSKKGKKRNKKKSILYANYEKQSNKKLPLIVNNEYRAKAPRVFSFLRNTSETIDMFYDIIEEINRGVYRRRFFFDSEDVQDITTDVLLYMVSIIRNIKQNKSKQYTFVGNLPKNEQAKRIFQESGLYKYVQTKSNDLPRNNEKMQIVTGSKTDSVLASEICKFVMKKFDVDKGYTNYLYKTLIELMSNTVHHAYNYKEEIMFPCWYLYAEYDNSTIRFVFVDTGLGIATTVRKKFYEKIVKKDSELIKSAFDGEFRTETKKDYRGLGLPALKEYAEYGYFSSFYVLSGSGEYKYNNNGMFTICDYFKKINGTIYIFEMVKKEE